MAHSVPSISLCRLNVFSLPSSSFVVTETSYVGPTASILNRWAISESQTSDNYLIALRSRCFGSAYVDDDNTRVDHDDGYVEETIRHPRRWVLLQDCSWLPETISTKDTNFSTKYVHWIPCLKYRQLNAKNDGRSLQSAHSTTPLRRKSLPSPHHTLPPRYHQTWTKPMRTPMRDNAAPTYGVRNT